MKRLVGALLLIAPGPACAEALPEAVAAMIRAADPKQVATVVALAKKTQPAATEEIDALAASLAAEREAARVAELSSQGALQGWSGEGTIGGTLTTGNTDERGLRASLAVQKQSLHWRHEIAARADFQKSEGIKTRERYFASYEGNLALSKRIYAYGLLQWEQDKFAGYRRRFTESFGLGWIAFDDPRFRLAFEAGPAFRQTRFVTALEENELNELGKVDFRWNITPRFRFTESAGYVLGGGNDTIFSNSALTAKLNGSLSTRLSFDVQYESDPKAGRETTDTISRFSVVYGF